jgi:endonuclease III-like uncharacterized protein
MNEINNQEIQSINSTKIQFLIDPPEFYNLSYNDLLYIKKVFSSLTPDLQDMFTDIEERIG